MLYKIVEHQRERNRLENNQIKDRLFTKKGQFQSPQQQWQSKDWNHVFNVMTKLRILYTEKLSFKNGDEIKTSSDKQTNKKKQCLFQQKTFTKGNSKGCSLDRKKFSHMRGIIQKVIISQKKQ